MAAKRATKTNVLMGCLLDGSHKPWLCVKVEESQAVST